MANGAPERVTHYEERLENDLNSIKDGVSQVGSWVQDNLWDAVLSLTRFDRTRANHTILKDRAVNRATEDLDHECHVFVVRHLPSAGHLRFVSSVLRATVAMERIGDYAVTVCRETLRLHAAPPEALAADLDTLGSQVANTVRSGIGAFVDGDVEAAAAGLGMARQVESTYRKVVRTLRDLGEQQALPVGDLFSLLISVRVLKRASDQAENLCEQTQFAVTGATKEAKSYRLLFVDRTGNLGKLAELFAEQVFPTEGLFESAATEPAEAYDPGLHEFVESRGVEVDGAPMALEERIDGAQRHYHVVAGIDLDPAVYIEHVPFRTVVLRWDIADAVGRAAAVEGRERYAILHRAVADEVTGLLEELGLEADR